MKGVAINYTPEQLDWIKAHSTMKRQDMGVLFNEAFNTDISYQTLSVCCKRKGWLTGRTGCFKKGSIPYNKGKKLDKGPNRTSFKKGHKPANWKPVGYERLSKEGYIETKTAEGMHQFKLKHRVLWEREHGNLDPGAIIRFKDNNPLNCCIENLEEVTRYENLLLNQSGYAHEKDELKPVVKALAKMQTKLHELKKSND